MTRAAVLGAGSWGTTFAKVLIDAGTSTVLWSRRPEVAAQVNAGRGNPDYLPDVALPEGLTATTDAARALDGADYVVLAVPSQTLRDNLTAWVSLLDDRMVLVSLMKGIELGTSMRMTEVLAEVTGVGPDRLAVVSGPNLALEIAAEQPTATVVACADQGQAHRLQAACHTPYFRPYTQTDVVGAELGGALKNVIALVVGVAEGMGFGDNTKASLITRGLAETVRLGTALGADPVTFAGLAGLGDLVATCTSPLSRNRTFGVALGRGATVAETVAATRQIAEGVKSCQSVLALGGRMDVDMPITEAVVAMVHDGLTPAQAVRRLTAREATAE